MGYSQTYCNPLPIPDYPRGKACREPGKAHDFRELADPTVIYHEGKWYLYPSCGMAWVSEDFVTWQHRKMNVYDLGYAPTVVAHRGAFLMTASGTAIYRAATPLGPWEEVGPALGTDGKPLPHFGDPMLFSDDDGRLYLYWGCGAPGIFGVEMDVTKVNQALTPTKLLFAYNPEHVWERVGEFNEDPSTSWCEGPWMIKERGRYFLTYAGPGTQWRTYGMGTYISDAPLGTFAYQKRNPILLDTEGLVRGPGHGCLVRGPRETLWAFYTCTVCYHHIFERRIGLDPAGFDAEGNLFVRGASEIPQWAPGIKEHPEQGNDAGLLPVTQSRQTKASSSAPGRVPLYAVDGSMKTWWQPAEDDREPWLEVNLEATFALSTLRVIWSEPNLDYAKQILPKPIRYCVEVRETLEGPWKVLFDGSANATDFLIDYRTFPARDARVARLILKETPAGMGTGVVDFSLFGVGKQPPKGKYGVWNGQ
jgi:xylan 1,4-beta-xylosidase